MFEDLGFVISYTLKYQYGYMPHRMAIFVNVFVAQFSYKTEKKSCEKSKNKTQLNSVIIVEMIRNVT